MGLHSNMHTTINMMGETHGTPVTYSGKITWESQKMRECENHVNDMQTRQTDELW